MKNFGLFRSLQALIVAAMLLSLLACSAPQTGPVAAEEPTPTPLPTAAALAKPTYTVARGDVVGLLRLTGRIAPVNEEEAFFRINGRVRNIYIEEGDAVQAGQVLADLEGIDELQRQLDRLQLNLRRSQLNAEMTRLGFDLFVETTSTYTKGYHTQLEMKKRELELADISVREASLGFDEVQFAISNTLLTAPLTGVVTALNLKSGREVQGYKAVAMVADVNLLEVSMSASPEYLNEIAVGMEATVLAASGLGEAAAASVRRMPISDRVGEAGDDTLRVSLAQSPLDLGYELGDLVKVTIILQKRIDVLWVPPQVVRTFEGRRFVVLQDGGAQRRVDVTLGVVGEERVEITAGLEEGQIVVSP